jgi:hypothetical protein
MGGREEAGTLSFLLAGFLLVGKEMEEEARVAEESRSRRRSLSSPIQLRSAEATGGRRGEGEDGIYGGDFSSSLLRVVVGEKKRPRRGDGVERLINWRSKHKSSEIK